MFDLDKWREILQALTRNKSRTFLTAFGIFWGIFLLVLLMGGTQGIKRMMQSTFDGFAQNSYLAMSAKTSLPSDGFQTGREWHLTVEDVRKVQQKVSGADVVTPIVAWWNVAYTYRDKKHSGTVKGIYPEYLNIENPKVNIGRFIQQNDLRDYRKVCVIGKRVASKLFPNEPKPLGHFISISGVYFQVIGISGLSNNIGIGGNAQDAIFVPFTTLQRLQNRGREIDLIAITADQGISVSDIQPQIEQQLKAEHHIAQADKNALQGINFEAMFQMVQSLFDGINILVWLIGIGTLISGSIGVSNIMMVVVKERTTEIGIRRAIGARPSNILTQILTESVTITIAAGLSGIVFAVIILAAIEMGVASNPDFPHVSFQISFQLAILSATALSLLGTAAGIAPAFRALAVKPIDAIRDE